MKSQFMLFKVCLILSVFFSCGTDMDDEDITPEAATFDLTLENNTGEEIEMFLKGRTSNEEFERFGVVYPDDNFTFSELSVRQTYVVRASFLGDNVEGFFYEQTINQTSPTDLTLVIDQ